MTLTRTYAGLVVFAGGCQPIPHDVVVGDASLRDAAVRDASTRDAGAPELDAGADAGTTVPKFTNLTYELFVPGPTRSVFGNLAPLDADGMHFDYGQLAAGSNYALALGLTGDGTSCARSSNGLNEADAVAFTVRASEDTEIRTQLRCSGAYNGSVEVSVLVHGAMQMCQLLRARSANAVVGDSIDLDWAATEPGAESYFRVTPLRVVGDLNLNTDSTGTFACKSAGTATISLLATKGACGGVDQSVQVECKAREGQQCCAIDPLDPSDASCLQFGGSPPCYTGCACFRNGGSARTQLDANGCLEWRIELSQSKPGLALCLDSDGVPAPDPRQPCGSYGSTIPPTQSGSCSDSDVRQALDSTELICATDPEQSCNAVGTWLITFARSSGKGSTPSSGNCTGKPAPPEIDLQLSAPGQLSITSDGCELRYQRIEHWQNASECGVFGYALRLRVDGDSAHGALHSVESGFCGKDISVAATATRIQ